jgi:hypothetical protein
MLPHQSNLTKCKKCNTIFFLHNSKRSEESIYGKKHPKDQEPESLNFDEIVRALKEKVAKTKYEKYLVRSELRCAFNNRIRGEMRMENIQHLNAKKIAVLEQQLFTNEKEKKFFYANCKAMIKLCNPKEAEDLLIIADLYRNLGEFETCMEIIDNLKGKLAEENYNYKKISYNYKRECKRRNPLVFELYTADQLKQFKAEV